MVLQWEPGCRFSTGPLTHRHVHGYYEAHGWLVQLAVGASKACIWWHEAGRGGLGHWPDGQQCARCFAPLTQSRPRLSSFAC